MLVSNCNKILVVPCGCTFEFQPAASSPAPARLSVGSLIGYNCSGVVTDYIIDWYLNGVIVLTTASSLSYASSKGVTINYLHPFTGNAAATVLSAGIYTPVIRMFQMDGQTIYGTPVKCRNYCTTNPLSPVTIEIAECGIVGGTPDAGYTYRVYYYPTQPTLSRTSAFPFKVNTSNKYIAVKFFAGQMYYDTFRLFYDDGNSRTALPTYKVGLDTATNNNLNQLRSQYLYLVVDFTQGRTVKNTDYIYIEIEASGTTDTEWSFNTICLDPEAFNITPGVSQCSYLHTGLREFNFPPIEGATKASVEHIPSPTCGYKFTFFLRQMISSDYSTSNLRNYTNIEQMSYPTISETGAFFIDFSSGEVRAMLYDNKTTNTGNPLITNSPATQTYNRFAWYNNPDSNIMSHICYDFRDYQAFKNMYNNSVKKDGTLYPVDGRYSDKTDVFYYQMRYYSHKQSNNALYVTNTYLEKFLCGDTFYGDGPTTYFHQASTITCSNNLSTIIGAGDTMDCLYEDMAEIRFRYLIKGTTGTQVTVTTIGDNLHCSVINKTAGMVGTRNGTVPAHRLDSILVRGTSGTLTFSGPGGFTHSIAIDTALEPIKTTLQNYFTQTIIEEYARKSIEISAYTTTELRFVTTTPNVACAAPTVSVSGDITYTVVKRTDPLPATTVEPIYPAVAASYSILLSGNTGTVTISTIGGITTSFTSSGDLGAVITEFTNTRDVYSGGTLIREGSVAVASYLAVGIILSSYSGFITVFDTHFYDGLRNDYNSSYNKTFIDLDPYWCNNRSNYVWGTTTPPNSRTLTVTSPSPSIGDYGAGGWSRGDIITGVTSGATCEILSWQGINKYDIKNVIGGTGTFTVGETLRNVAGDKTAIFSSVTAKRIASSGSSSCRNGTWPNGIKISTYEVKEIYKDFLYYYRYPLSSLNTLCYDDTEWKTVGEEDRYYVMYVTLNFNRTDLEVDQDSAGIKTKRRENFEIYTRIDENGNTFSVLRVNALPSTSWSVNDIITGLTSGAHCKIVGSFVDPGDPEALGYYVNEVSGTFIDAEKIGVTGVGEKQAQQTLGAPRIVGKLVYKEAGGTQVFPII